MADEEDVALCALSSFCRAAQAGRFPRLDDRDALWKLLATITERKAADQRKHAGRLKRGGGRVRGDSAFLYAGDSTGDAFTAADPHVPTPDEAATCAETFEQRLNQLDDPSLVEVAVLKLEGWTNNEIAERIGRTTRSVERKLERIRLRWSSDPAPS